MLRARVLAALERVLERAHERRDERPQRAGVAAVEIGPDGLCGDTSILPAPIFSTSSSGPKPPTCFTSGMITSHPAVLGDLPEPRAAPEQLAARRRASACAAAELVVAGPDGERLFDPVELQALELGHDPVEVLRPKSLVKVDAHARARKICSRKRRERREPRRRLFDGALGTVDGLERRALERLESLLAQLRRRSPRIPRRYASVVRA